MPPLPWDPPLLTFLPSLCIPSLLDLLLLALKKRPESSALVGLQPPPDPLGLHPNPLQPIFPHNHGSYGADPTSHPPGPF